VTIELTPAQAVAVAELSGRVGAVTLHQVATSTDVFATPQGTSEGYRIAATGKLSRIGETLPAAG
jgi:hypothetical protein